MRLQYQAATTSPFPFVKIDWFAPLSEPVRTRAFSPAAQQALAPDPLPRVSFGWWAAALSESVRLKPPPPTGQQHVLELEPAPIVSIAWHLPLAEPVRLKPGLAAGARQVLALPPRPDIRLGWPPPWSEPVRLRPAMLVPAQEQQLQPFDEDIVFADRWFAWWSEPVRIKPALGAASHQVLAFDPQPFPFLGGGGGWYLPSSAEEASEGKPAVARRAKAGAPRQVEPKQEPPTFADTIAAQQPARLADVLGSAFVPQLAQALQPPALDLWTPSSGDPSRTARGPRAGGDGSHAAAIDAAHDHADALDAMEALQALDELEQQEREAVIAVLLHHLSEG